jgi:3-oxoacyl-[acyl-carrier protein] reductase
MEMGQTFSNKTVVITGGSRGMGAAMVQAFAAEGARVVFTYAKSAPEAEALVAKVSKAGGKAEAVQADARNPEQLSRTLGTVGQKLGKVDVLINNAGVFLDSPMGEASAWDNFEQMLTVNVRSVFAGTQALLPVLADGGRIITIGSVMGESAMWPNFSGYAATKHAVAGLSSGWAYDLAPRNITVNTVEPGPINTDMNPEHSDGADMMRAGVPLKRYGQPQEVTDLVMFLASDKAAYISGARIKIGGGLLA